MLEIQEDKKPERVLNRRVHMANERTFLAWIRTSIGIMAFGFVVEKFALFIKQVSFFLGKSTMEEARLPTSTVFDRSKYVNYVIYFKNCVTLLTFGYNIFVK